VEIPYKKLNPDALRAVITEYVTRESTDYGGKAFSLDEKIAEVKLQLENGSAKIVYDSVSGSCNIVPVS